MPLSPLEAKFVAALDDGRLLIFGADGNEGEGGDDGNDDDENVHPDVKAAREAQRKAEEKAAELETKHKEADKRAKELEKSIADKEKEGMEEAEKTSLERDEFKEKYEKLLKVVETTFIDQAITNISGVKDKTGQPKYNWQDATAVRAFLDREGIEIDVDSGEVKGLDKQIAEIAKNRPYLLVPQDGEGGGNGGGAGDYKPPPGSTGNHPFGGQPRQRTTDRAALASKYRLPGAATAGAGRPI